MHRLDVLVGVNSCVFPDCPRWRLGYPLPGFQGFIDQDPCHHGNRPLFLFGKRLKLPHCFIVKSKGNRICILLPWLSSHARNVARNFY